VTRNAAFHEIWLHYNALCTQTQKPTITVFFFIQNVVITFGEKIFSKLQTDFHGQNGECTLNFVNNRKQNTPNMSQNAFCPQISNFNNNMDLKNNNSNNMDLKNCVTIKKIYFRKTCLNIWRVQMQKPLNAILNFLL